MTCDKLQVSFSKKLLNTKLLDRLSFLLGQAIHEIMNVDLSNEELVFANLQNAQYISNKTNARNWMLIAKSKLHRGVNKMHLTDKDLHLK